MFVILSAQVLNRSSLQGNGHGLACKLRGFALGGNSYVPIEQTEEVNIPNLYNTFTLFRPELLRRATTELDVWSNGKENVREIGPMLDIGRGPAVAKQAWPKIGLLSSSNPDSKQVCCHLASLTWNMPACMKEAWP